ncbi:AcrR family transcriptional regulator [Rhodoligotrophos appendicifer]|uniref:TetR/AcrR family transcriptional regulator n=1 Tax=Rhodoligotrophos appendicifer TaxID=987056 RepID=UPI00195FFE47|nr:TetR/AcrR family transcriptional regulator [Rhodoligotrophos appendicifer]
MTANRAMTTQPAQKLTRAEKGQKIKADLFHAAAKVVGEVGYANALVSLITANAKVAQGTFYNHFDSRQDLFDQLLPALGAELLDFIRAQAHGAPDAIERERRSFLSFFEFIKLKPEFYRILYEAEVFAPRAFQMHMDRIADAYIRTLERGFGNGEVVFSDRRQLEALAFSLMGARQYLCMRFARQDGQTVDLPDWVTESYMTLVTQGIYRLSAAAR